LSKIKFIIGLLFFFSIKISYPSELDLSYTQVKHISGQTSLQKQNSSEKKSGLLSAFKNMGADGRKNLLDADKQKRKKTEKGQGKKKGGGRGRGEGRGKRSEY